MIHLEQIAEVRLGHPFRGAVPVDPAGNERVIQSRDLADAHGVIAGPLARTQMDKPDERTRALANDVLLQSRGNHFQAARVGDGAENAIVASPLYLVRPDPTRADAAFLVLLLNADLLQAQLRAAATGSYILQVPAGAIRSLELPLPPLEIQRVLAELGALADEEARLAAALAAQHTARLLALAHRLDGTEADRNSRGHANAPG